MSNEPPRSDDTADGERADSQEVRPVDTENAAMADTAETNGSDLAALEGDDDSSETTTVVSDAADSADAPADFDRSDPAYYLNRELSELEFQKRVLHEATDERNPLLEQVKFLSIFTTNMDEFFRKRVGGLKQQIEAGVTERTPDGRTPREQWDEILEIARPMFERQTECYHETVRPALADAGVRILDYDDLSADERGDLRAYFESSVLPTLTPLTFDPAHPFPHISNLSLSLGVLTRENPNDDLTFSRVKVPQNRPRLVRVGGDSGDSGTESASADDRNARFVLIEDVIADNLDLLFPNVEIVDYSTFRVTRNAEVGRDEEVAEDLIEMIEEVLEERRFATVVRLEIEDDAHPLVREILADRLDLDDCEIFERRGPLAFRDFDSLLELDRPDLKLDDWSPKPHPRLADIGTDDRDIFDVIRADDVLVHHPYHSFTGTVQQFLETAARDPDVLAIKAAIYRTASDSKVVETLIEAARNGKQVAVMVELKARFDEQNNLEWAKKLEAEGIHVAYGTIGFKTHTKTSLVVRDEDDSEGVQLYSHVGTGNYHSETAKRYDDLGLLTADRDVGQDLVKLFNYFTGHSLHEQYRELLVAPGNMRERFVDLIRNEAECARRGEDASITAKVNRLEDPEMVAELYEASMAGVDIDLVVRDICRLRPGLAGVSDNVDVYSVVGRFLEHSRIYRFGNDDPGYYVGSADWMTRNLDNRVEAIAPIEDPRLQSKLDWVLETFLSDNRKRWVMHSDGSYEQIRPAEGEAVRNAQETFMRETEEALRNRDGSR
ncbi:polyphosphate kinase 1 [Halorussus pelagicus]|uniref:polyphosphate kinase 1 n=1 Tax=Halorussus pelagicus TaxID=2505977 RepID=UPI000FFBB651|nr:polyphosphate kinase 1 [Halorussus pelagicus]